MKSKIVSLSITVVIAVIGLTMLGLFFSVNNRDVSLRERAKEQKGNIENMRDAMWKILQQKASVTDQYKDAFSKIYPELIAGRYSDKGGSLMKWIQESNPNFDVSLYKDLMVSIEIERKNFANEQKKMLDIIREHSTFIKSVPNKWFVSDTTSIKYTVISSTTTKKIMESGVEDDIDLFKK